MQEKAAQSVPDEGPVRVLNTRGLLLHHAHLRREPAKVLPSCGICTSGMGSIVTTLEKKVVESKPVVDEGDGTNKEGDSTSPPASRWDRRES